MSLNKTIKLASHNKYHGMKKCKKCMSGEYKACASGIGLRKYISASSQVKHNW